MKGRVFVKVAGLLIAAALLAGCYAPLANQNGHLNFDLRFVGGAKSATNEVIGLVVNADYRDNFKEMLNLVGKGHAGTLSGSEVDRLTELGKLMATSGLVKFGGFPFFQTSMDPSSGNFDLTGIPAGRDYFIKLFVFHAGHSLDVKDIDKDFWKLIQYENMVFGNPSHPANPESYFSDTDWQGWTPATGQPVSVKAGESSTIAVTLTTTIP
jgi:hypothetical protein